MIGPQFPEEHPDAVAHATLRQFAGLCVAIFGGMFAWSWYRHSGTPTTLAWVGLGLAVVVGLGGLIHPPAIRPVFLALMAVTRPIGHVLSTVLIGLIYWGLLTPLALLFRLLGRDALARRRVVTESYWMPKSQPSDVRRYLHQYQGQRAARSESPGNTDHGSAQLA
jgi:hypothetical protein